MPRQAVVYWQAARPLRWSDFQAAACPPLLHHNERQIGACCATTIVLLPCTDARGRSTYLVESFLNKANSWVRDSTSFANRLVLAHEQVHFDINELYARKIREVVADYYRAGRYPFGADLHEQLEWLLLQKNTCNNRFDAEAAQDSIGGYVNRWHASIGQQLADLAPYRADACACSQH